MLLIIMIVIISFKRMKGGKNIKRLNVLTNEVTVSSTEKFEQGRKFLMVYFPALR